MHFLTLLLFLIPAVVLGKTDSATEWSNEDSFTLIPKTLRPTTAPASSIPNVEFKPSETDEKNQLQKDDEFKTDAPAKNSLLPFLINQFIEDKLNEIENNNTESIKQADSSTKKWNKDEVKEPALFLIPPEPYRPVKTKLISSSESSEEKSDELISTTTDGSITETTTSDSIEVEDDDSSETTGLTTNSIQSQIVQNPIPKIYAENYQNYIEISTTTEKSMNIMNSIGDDNKDSQFVGISTEEPIIESTPLNPETPQIHHNMMDKVIYDIPESIVSNDNRLPSQDRFVKHHPQYVMFLRPSLSSEGSSLMNKMFYPNKVNQESSVYSDQDISSDDSTRNQQLEPPMTMTQDYSYSSPYLNSYNPIRPMSNYYQYPQFQRNPFPIRNAMMMMMNQPQSYYNPQMASPQMSMPTYSNPGYLGNNYRNNYWTQPFYTRPNYFNNYPYSRSFNYAPIRGQYGMTPYNYYAT